MKDHNLNIGKRELPAAVHVVNNTTHGIAQKTSSPNIGSVSQHRQTVQTQQSPGVTSRTSHAKPPTLTYSNGTHNQTHFKAPTRKSHHKRPEGSGIPTDVSLFSFFIHHSLLQTLLWLF